MCIRDRYRYVASFSLSSGRSTLYGRKHPPKADPPSGGKLAFEDGENGDAQGVESMRLTLYIVLIPFARRARLSREGDLFRDSVFAVGGRFCLGRAKRLRGTR